MHLCVQDYSVGMFLYQTWNDPRLSFPSSDNRTKVRLFDVSIWIPDTFIVNEKSAAYHRVTVPNQLFYVYASGDVVYVIRSGHTFHELDDAVPHDVENIPFDRDVTWKTRSTPQR